MLEATNQNQSKILKVWSLIFPNPKLTPFFQFILIPQVHYKYWLHELKIITHYREYIERRETQEERETNALYIQYTICSYNDTNSSNNTVNIMKVRH